MFPDNIVTPCTFYIFASDNENNLVTSHRALLQGCYYEPQASFLHRETGVQIRGQVMINVPMDKATTGRTWVGPREWYNLPIGELPNYWTFDDLQQATSFVIRGVCEHEFEWLPMPQHSQAIATFVNNGGYDVKRPQTVDPLPHGDFPYVEISAR